MYTQSNLDYPVFPRLEKKSSLLEIWILVRQNKTKNSVGNKLFSKSLPIRTELNALHLQHGWVPSMFAVWKHFPMLKFKLYQNDSFYGSSSCLEHQHPWEIQGRRIIITGVLLYNSLENQGWTALCCQFKIFLPYYFQPVIFQLSRYQHYSASLLSNQDKYHEYQKQAGSKKLKRKKLKDGMCLWAEYVHWNLNFGWT